MVDAFANGQFAATTLLGNPRFTTQFRCVLLALMQFLDLWFPNHLVYPSPSLLIRGVLLGAGPYDGLWRMNSGR